MRPNVETDVPAGLHFKLPFGIDTATVVPVKRQLKQEFGFTTPNARDPYQGARDRKQETKREIEMVTGDLNAALVEWVTQYRTSDPVNFLFEVRKPSETLRDVSESVMREVVDDRTVDEVITIGRQEIESAALAKMQALSSRYAIGISIDQVQLKNINPPEPVQVSFNEVNQAQQEKEKPTHEARRGYNKVIPSQFICSLQPRSILLSVAITYGMIPAPFTYLRLRHSRISNTLRDVRGHSGDV